jgi:hypothetical protein
MLKLIVLREMLHWPDQIRSAGSRFRNVAIGRRRATCGNIDLGVEGIMRRKLLRWLW